jgi:hypothetical protein
MAGRVGRMTIRAANEETPRANEGYVSETQPTSKEPDMTIIVSTSDVNNVMGEPERKMLLARIDADEATARAAKCDTPDCDGFMHEANAEPSEWYHRVYHRRTDSLEVEVTRHSDGHYYGWMAIDIIDDASPSEMREYAAECAKQATELLAAAALVDALNGVKA